VRALIDRLAPGYDAVGPARFAYSGRRLVGAVGVGAGQRVLDVACGRGTVLFLAAARVAAGDVVGIDLATAGVCGRDIVLPRPSPAPGAGRCWRSAGGAVM
jgi:ubiquinone/menaquinone biosynthesis C-methylase UbiE